MFVKHELEMHLKVNIEFELNLFHICIQQTKVQLNKI